VVNTDAEGRHGGVSLHGQLVEVEFELGPEKMHRDQVVCKAMSNFPA
jgi:hypothetical protein